MRPAGAASRAWKSLSGRNGSSRPFVLKPLPVTHRSMSLSRRALIGSIAAAGLMGPQRLLAAKLDPVLSAARAALTRLGLL